MEQAVMDKKDLDKFSKLPLKDQKHPNKKFSEKEEKNLRELITYEFMNLEEPGLTMSFVYGNSSNKQKFTFFHGGKYTVPKFIARHVESKSTPIWAWRPDGMGGMKKELTGYKSRFQMREVYE